MQTFLPYAHFQSSAEVLDYRRLGKQRVEALQILTTLVTGRKAWANHPATLMWKGYEQALAEYGRACCEEWVSNRGFKDTCRDKINALLGPPGAGATLVQTYRMPPWLGDPEFHASHRSNLLRKSPQYYYRFNWAEPDDLPYVWPVVGA